MINLDKLNISIIAAMDQNRAIGNNNNLLWHLPNDLKRFKKITMGKPIIMGRKTFESIGRVLPGRENIILTTQSDYEHSARGDIIVFNNLNNLLEYLIKKYSNTEVMVIGGAEIYKLFLDYANKIYLTIVDTEDESLTADTYFPEIDKTIWLEDSPTIQVFSKDSKHKYNYVFTEFNHN